MSRRKQLTTKRRKGDRYRGPFWRPFAEMKRYLTRSTIPIRITTSKSRGGRRARRFGL